MTASLNPGDCVRRRVYRTGSPCCRRFGPVQVTGGSRFRALASRALGSPPEPVQLSNQSITVVTLNLDQAVANCPAGTATLLELSCQLVERIRGQRQPRNHRDPLALPALCFAAHPDRPASRNIAGFRGFRCLADAVGQWPQAAGTDPAHPRRIHDSTLGTRFHDYLLFSKGCRKAPTQLRWGAPTPEPG